MGKFLWAKKAGSGGFDMGNGITVDGYGNSYITGSIPAPGTFDTFQLPTYGSGDIFLAKYDPNGNCLWVKHAGGIHGDGANGISSDLKGNVFLTGCFNGPATFGTIQLVGYGV